MNKGNLLVNFEQLPSLDLAFEWVKGVLYDQVKIAENYNTRLTALLSVATLIIGIGFPVGVSIIGNFSNKFLFLMAIVSYILLVISVCYGFWLRKLYTMDEPAKIREEYLGLLHEEFKLEILMHTEDYYHINGGTIKKRVWATYATILLLAVETISLVLAFALTLFGS